MKNSITIKIETQSNLFIGGTPIPFEIGGVDQRTVTDSKGFPCIPGSSLKGALRNIIREDESETGEKIVQLYAEYLREEKARNWPQIEALALEEEALERIQKRYQEAETQLSPQFLFGIEGFNNTPKLLFSDFLVCPQVKHKESCFSIDMKNTICIGESAPESNPRTYQAARPGLVFEGEIRLYKIGLLGSCAVKLCTQYITDNLLKFNEGIYRLGNSKSRGYGKVKILTADENGEQIV